MNLYFFVLRNSTIGPSLLSTISIVEVYNRSSYISLLSNSLGQPHMHHYLMITARVGMIGR